MIQRFSVLLGLVLAAALLPSSASAEPVVRAQDAAGDVKLTSNGPINAKQRRSIDLRQVAVDTTSGGATFAVKLKDIGRSKKFDQVVLLTLRGKVPAGRVHGDYGFSPQKRGLGFASLTVSGTGTTSCEPRTTVVRKQNLVRFFVPDECLPSSPTKLRVTSVTGQFRTDAPVGSRDKLKVPGRLSFL